MFIEELGSKEYDVIIVGSGPAGISLANKLLDDSALSILMIESGGFEPNAEINKLSEIKSTGDQPDCYYQLHSQRIFGGTSNIWSGFCSILEERSFLNGEWPIKFSDLLPYYPEAASILDLSKNSFELPHQNIGNQEEILFRPYYLSTPTRFGKKFLNTLGESEQIDILLNTTCLELVHDKHFDKIKVQTSGNAQSPIQELSGKYIVLACGGLGNPKILQISKIATNSPVGNYFMGHPHINSIGEIELNYDLLIPVIRKSGKKKMWPAIQLGDRYCIDNNVLNFTLSFTPKENDERLLLGKKIKVIISDTWVKGEMEPKIENWIILGIEKDHQGQPMGQVNFIFDYQKLAEKSWKLFSDSLLRHGIGRIITPLNIFKITDRGGHLIGTTRMGNNAEYSVVDENCKVHGTDNLFIAGSSIFPASGAANPTFSVGAFALRLADHIAALI